MADECPECGKMTLHRRTRRLHYLFGGAPGDLVDEVVCVNCGFVEELGVIEEEILLNDEEDDDYEEDEE